MRDQLPSYTLGLCIIRLRLITTILECGKRVKERTGKQRFRPVSNEYIIFHTRDSIRKLVKACYNARDKALISVLRRATGYEIKSSVHKRGSDGNVYDGEFEITHL